MTVGRRHDRGDRRRAATRIVVLVVALVACGTAVAMWAFAFTRAPRPLGTPSATGVARPPEDEPSGTVIASWQMDEPAGTSVLRDSSGHGIEGTVGTTVETGVRDGGTTFYRWTSRSTPRGGTDAERLIIVSEPELNPRDDDFTITVRFRTTAEDGNLIQKGQSETPGGYFKWELPEGQLACLFRSRDAEGDLIGERAVSSPPETPINDGGWHTVVCRKTGDRVTMTIDDDTTVTSKIGPIGPIGNDFPLTIGGKSACDGVEVMCDYFVGDIDFIVIERG